MPFDPPDLIPGKLAFPPRDRFGADLRKVYARRGVAAPEPTRFRRRQHCARIEVDPEVSANFFHRTSWFAHKPFVLNDQPWNLRVMDAPSQFRSDSPMRDYVVSREASCLSRILQCDLRCEDRAWVPQRNQNFCIREP